MTSRTRPARGGRLSANDWVDAAFDLLAERGVEAITVNDLAAWLGVTKGSFYWHFKDRDEFRRAMSADWAGRRTVQRVAAVEERAADPKGRLRGLRDQGRAVAAADRAMRAWARTDPDIAAAVAAADELIYRTLRRCFIDLGFDARDADVRARTLIYAFVGQYEVRLPSGRRAADRFDRLLAILTAGADAP